MLKPADEYFAGKQEPLKSCLEFLRAHILAADEHISEIWNYGMPFYSYKGKRLCYLWVHKKLRQPYIGFVDGHQLNHPGLLQEKRTRMKILLIDPYNDIPVKKIDTVLYAALALHD